MRRFENGFTGFKQFQILKPVKVQYPCGFQVMVSWFQGSIIYIVNYYYNLLDTKLFLKQNLKPSAISADNKFIIKHL